MEACANKSCNNDFEVDDLIRHNHRVIINGMTVCFDFCVVCHSQALEGIPYPVDRDKFYLFVLDTRNNNQLANSKK